MGGEGRQTIESDEVRSAGRVARPAHLAGPAGGVEEEDLLAKAAGAIVAPFARRDLSAKDDHLAAREREAGTYAPLRHDLGLVVHDPLAVRNVVRQVVPSEEESVVVVSFAAFGGIDAKRDR